jgi:hypothetical protein
VRTKADIGYSQRRPSYKDSSIAFLGRLFLFHCPAGERCISPFHGSMTLPAKSAFEPN